MKVHITLVGGQPAPVYHGIVATQPDKVVFIYSESSRDVVEKVRSEIHVAEDEQEPLNTTDPQLIMVRAKALAEKYKEDEVTLNISSGLKSWSLRLSIWTKTMCFGTIGRWSTSPILSLIWMFSSVCMAIDWKIIKG